MAKTKYTSKTNERITRGDRVYDLVAGEPVEIKYDGDAEQLLGVGLIEEVTE